MDSFFSLFDPSDGHKKKRSPENERAEGGGKGRRRGRRQGKSESLSEECSFLCAPELSGEVLVTDGSYMESHMRDDKAESEKKPRRRNSGRKNRRKKNKVSPSKDLIANNAWTENDAISDTDTTWNNQTDKPKICDDNVGKNVNDLKTDYKKSKTKSIEQFIGDADIGSYEEREMYSVAESLDKVKIQDDLFLAGDFNESDLESDFFYQSDEEVEFDESASSDSDSSSSCGRLPPEPRFGNVEYKLQLVAPGERRFQHLVTQLKWRLVSGGGRCVYVVGVRDCGRVRGLRAPALGASLRTLARMARHIGASPTHLTLRKVARDRALAEMYIRKLADTQQSVELRVAVMGANEAGKSTLIGVLTQGELDNGRGSARLNMFRHVHEVRSGRTSSLSHEILGFDAQGNVVNYGCSELMTAERIGERSAKLVSFLDLAGHSKYQRTTLHGLTGYSPHYAMLVISATAGITRITEEHIGLLLALDLPFLTVVTKTELAPVAGILGRLAALLAPANKRPVLITDENASEYIAPHKIIDGIDTEQDEHDNVLVFSVSCVSGAGLRALHLALHTLAPPDTAPPQEPCEFQIDEIFRVGGSEGPVVGGLLAAGGLREGDQVLLGPLETGEFTPITVKSIYRNRVPHGCVRAGQSASLGLAPTRAQLRPGMVLLSADTREPSPAMMPPLIPAESTLARRRNKNLLQQLETAETCLRKSGDGAGNEFREDDYTSDSYKERLERSAGSPLDKVINTGDRERGERGEENTGPRGTLYFQASVQVLRHVSRLRAGFQCVVHVANVRQTARIEGILSHGGVLRAGETASVVFRFLRCPEYVRPGRRLLFTAGLGTRAIGRVTQVFPYVP